MKCYYIRRFISSQEQSQNYHIFSHMTHKVMVAIFAIIMITPETFRKSSYLSLCNNIGPSGPSATIRSIPCYAVLCCAVLCCAVLCCAVLCCAVLCCAVLCCSVPCRAVPCRAVPCRAVPCRAVPCRAVPCHAMPCHAMP